MVEFKIASRDKKPNLMEVNGRFWGSLNLAILSGVDFPFLLYKMISEGDIKPTLNYKTGIKSRWLAGDIFRIISVLTNNYDKEIVKNLKKEKELKEFLTFREKKLFYDMFSKEDTMPGIINLIFSLQRTLSKF